MTEDTSEVSILITTYYRNDLLENAIESALEQTYGPIEIIVLDDSGEAHARPVVDRYDAVEYVPLAGSCGPHAARNVGLTHANGSYIQFLDDDDALHPEKITRQLPQFSDSVGVVYSGFRSPETGRVFLPDPAMRGQVLEKVLRLDQQSLDACFTSTMLIDRQVIDHIMPLRNCHGADDLGMKIELALRTEFDYVNEPLVERHMDNEGHLGQSMENVRGRLLLLERYSRLYDRFPPEIRRSVACDTYRLGGLRLLRERMWSLLAVSFFFRAALYSSSERWKHVGLMLASLFGAPGLWISRRVSSFVTSWGLD